MAGQTPQGIRVFRARQQVRVRRAPGLRAEHLRWLAAGEQITVDAASRTEADGYIWWQHGEGWTAERTLDGVEVYLIDAGLAAETIRFRVGEAPVRVRATPGFGGEPVGWLTPGTVLAANSASRTVLEGHIWWQHAGGWSAERTLDGAAVYFAPLEAETPAPAAEAPAPPARTRDFVVVQQVRVRTAPGRQGGHIRWLPRDTRLTVDAASRTEADGHVWWRHAEGWSAERRLDGGEIYLQELAGEGPAPAPPILLIRPFAIVESVRVRQAPGLNATFVRWLEPGQTINVDATSRTEADGYVWWRHAEGWSAECALDGSATYLVDPATLPPATPPEAPPPGEQAATRTFQAGHQQVRIRDIPALRGVHLGWLLPGEQITVRRSSRTVADGYVWWAHERGWSAECSASGAERYLFDPAEFANRPPVPGPRFEEGLPLPETLPLLDGLFSRLPIPLEKTHWWQYFGNNVFAYNLWASGARSYAYAQGLHGGVDFGNSQEAVPVVAGLNGVFIKRETRYTLPNGMWVKAGDYTVIFGHLANPAPLAPGAAITPETVLGTLELGGQNHVHVEIRYRERWIVNPLLFMPPALRESLIAKFPPGPRYFYRDEAWNRWVTPLDQPVLILAGPLIGPHAPH